MSRNETIIPQLTKALNNQNKNENIYISLNNLEIYNIDSGRLVDYSGSEPESEGEQDRAGVSPTRHPSSPPSSGSPSPSPEQRRRNRQAEQVLANFGSASLLALLGESLRREQSDRNMVLQRALHDAGAFRVRVTFPIMLNQYKYMKFFDIDTSKVSQKMAGYLAIKVQTWDDAKLVYKLETEGLAILHAQQELTTLRILSR